MVSGLIPCAAHRPRLIPNVCAGVMVLPHKHFEVATARLSSPGNNKLDKAGLTYPGYVFSGALTVQATPGSALVPEWDEGRTNRYMSSASFGEKIPSYEPLTPTYEYSRTLRDERTDMSLPHTLTSSAPVTPEHINNALPHVPNGGNDPNLKVTIESQGDSLVRVVSLL